MRRIQYLIAAHCIGILTLVVAIGAGTHFHAGKLSSLTTGPVSADKADYPATLKRVLQQPAYNERGDISTVSAELPPDVDVYAYGQSREVETNSLALLCTDLQRNYGNWPPQGSSSVGSRSDDINFPNNIQETETAVAELASADFAVVDSPPGNGYGRRCVVWNADAKGHAKRYVKLMEKVKCLLTPNYPFHRLSKLLLRTILGNLVLILLAWSHSLTLPQPISMVHAPRLVIYALLDAWRILFLYALKTAVEAIPMIQKSLQSLEARVSSGGRAEPASGDFASLFKQHVFPKLNGYGGSAKFDSSDHVVLYSMLGLIVMTELVCMVTYRRQEKKAIDNPFTVKKRGLFVMGTVNFSLLALLLYNTFLTSLYFHTPLETWAGLLISALGIYLPFWLALFFLESLNFYF